MAKKFNFIKGRDGENEARNYLEKQGFKFISANYKNKIGEIDLVMMDKDCLVFVEVKLKTGTYSGNPEDMIDSRKLYQIKRTAESYAVENDLNIYKQKFRIDAVCIVKNTDNSIERINHYKNLY